jgi:hypothetical protein
MRALTLPAVVTLTALAGLAACGDSIVKGWLVDRTRVIGARVEAATDATRASIAPGEMARVSWVIATPAGVPHVAWAIAACVPPSGTSAAPACPTGALAESHGTADGEVVATDVVVPSGVTNETLLVLAAFCEGGTPALDPTTFVATCAGAPDAPLLASAVMRLAAAGPNLNPAPPSGVRLGPTPLAASDVAAGMPCSDPRASALPRLAAGGPDVDLVYPFRAADREPGESLVLSTLVTEGKLDAQYASLEATEALPKEVHVAWTPPGVEVGPEGRVVRFFVGLRDGRGGAAFSGFAVCIRPGG